MDLAAGLTIGAYVFLSVLNVWAAGKQKRKLFLISKPLLMPALIGVYLTGSSAPALEVVFALFFAWCGDLLLLGSTEVRAKSQKQEAWRPVFLAGLAFGLGHLLYTVTFCRLASSSCEGKLYLAVMLFYIIIGKLLYEAFIRSLPGFDRLMKFEAGLYLLVILMMTFSSALIINCNHLNSFLPLAGSWLFILSDCLLAAGYASNSIRCQPWVMGCYSMAQLLIVTGLVLLGS